LSLEVTSIDGVVSPVLQAYVAPPAAVKVTVVPRHALDPDEVIVATGVGFTVTTTAEDVEEHPEAFVTVT
jgi:hypothetical protein